MGCVASKLDINDVHPNTFAVLNVDEIGNKVCPGKLEITDSNLVLYQKGKEPISWPFKSLRRYGFEAEIFSFESGRRCPTGPGIYAFKCRRAENLFNLLQARIRSREPGSSIDAGRGGEGSPPGGGNSPPTGETSVSHQVNSGGWPLTQSQVEAGEPFSPDAEEANMAPIWPTQHHQLHNNNNSVTSTQLACSSNGDIAEDKSKPQQMYMNCDITGQQQPQMTASSSQMDPHNRVLSASASVPTGGSSNSHSIVSTTAQMPGDRSSARRSFHRTTTTGSNQHHVPPPLPLDIINQSMMNAGHGRVPPLHHSSDLFSPDSPSHQYENVGLDPTQSPGFYPASSLFSLSHKPMYTKQDSSYSLLGDNASPTSYATPPHTPLSPPGLPSSPLNYAVLDLDSQEDVLNNHPPNGQAAKSGGGVGYATIDFDKTSALIISANQRTVEKEDEHSGRKSRHNSTIGERHKKFSIPSE